MIGWIRVKLFGHQSTNSEIIEKIELAQSNLASAQDALSHEVDAIKLRNKQNTTKISEILDDTLRALHKEKRR